MKHKNTKPPTLESLMNALRSNMVGLGDVANQVERKIVQKGVCLEDNPSAKRPHLEAAPASNRAPPFDDHYLPLPKRPHRFTQQSSTADVTDPCRSSACQHLEVRLPALVSPSDKEWIEACTRVLKFKST